MSAGSVEMEWKFIKRSWDLSRNIVKWAHTMFALDCTSVGLCNRTNKHAKHQFKIKVLRLQGCAVFTFTSQNDGNDTEIYWHHQYISTWYVLKPVYLNTTYDATHISKNSDTFESVHFFLPDWSTRFKATVLRTSSWRWPGTSSLMASTGVEWWLSSIWPTGWYTG